MKQARRTLGKRNHQRILEGNGEEEKDQERGMTWRSRVNVGQPSHVARDVHFDEASVVHWIWYLRCHQTSHSCCVRSGSSL